MNNFTSEEAKHKCTTCKHVNDCIESFRRTPDEIYNCNDFVFLTDLLGRRNAVANAISRVSYDAVPGYYGKD